MNTDIPLKYTELVGKKASMGGGLFSSKNSLEFEEYDVLDIRWGSAKICNTKTLKMLHPTIEYLIKKEGMRASKWTRPFAVREIQLKAEEE